MYKTKPTLAAILVCCFMSLCLVPTSEGQTRVGVYQSPKGVGIACDIFHNQGNEFSSFILTSDFHGMLTGDEKHPGIKGSYHHNFIIGESRPYNGGSIHFFAGPGLSLGYLRDNEKDFGTMAALSGDIGILMSFDKATLSLGITGEAGVHMHKDRHSSTNVISLYQNGLFRTWMPELKILCNFGIVEERALKNTNLNRFKIGFEWGYQASLMDYYDNVYLNEVGGRVSDKGKTFDYQSNGYLMIRMGCDLTGNSNLSFLAGFAGIHENVRDVPLTIRYTYSLNGCNSSGFHFFVEPGIGIPAQIDRKGPDTLMKLGTGYRVHIGGTTSVDFNVSLNGAHSRPAEIFDKYAGQIVSGNKVFSAKSNYLGIGAGMALNLF